MVAKGRCSLLDDDEELVAGYHEIYFAIDYEIFVVIRMYIVLLNF